MVCVAFCDAGDDTGCTYYAPSTCVGRPKGRDGIRPGRRSMLEAQAIGRKGKETSN